MRRSSDGIPGVRLAASATSASSARSRTSGCAAARCNAGSRRDWPASRSSSSRPAAPPGPRRRASRSKISGPTTSCSATRCPTSTFPRGSNWLMLGPSGPRRLRLSVEHLAQYRGGICFCVDLDPRWVIKLIKKGWSEHSRPTRRMSSTRRSPSSRPATTSGACSPRRSCSSRSRCGWNRWARRSGRWGSPGSSRAGRSSRRSGTASRTRSCSTAPI